MIVLRDEIHRRNAEAALTIWAEARARRRAAVAAEADAIAWRRDAEAAADGALKDLEAALEAAGGIFNVGYVAARQADCTIHVNPRLMGRKS